jgi:hypothetical protein
VHLLAGSSGGLVVDEVSLGQHHDLGQLRDARVDSNLPVSTPVPTTPGA